MVSDGARLRVTPTSESVDVLTCLSLSPVNPCDEGEPNRSARSKRENGAVNGVTASAIRAELYSWHAPLAPDREDRVLQ